MPLPHTIRPEPRMQDAIAERARPVPAAASTAHISSRSMWWQKRRLLDLQHADRAALPWARPRCRTIPHWRRAPRPSRSCRPSIPALCCRNSSPSSAPRSIASAWPNCRQPGERLVGRRVQYVRQRLLDRGSASARPTYGRVPDSPEGTVDHCSASRVNSSPSRRSAADDASAQALSPGSTPRADRVPGRIRLRATAMSGSSLTNPDFPKF